MKFVCIWLFHCGAYRHVTVCSVVFIPFTASHRCTSLVTPDSKYSQAHSGTEIPVKFCHNDIKVLALLFPWIGVLLIPVHNIIWRHVPFHKRTINRTTSVMGTGSLLSGCIIPHGTTDDNTRVTSQEWRYHDASGRSLGPMNSFKQQFFGRLRI
jgi:hypothetical protein